MMAIVWMSTISCVCITVPKPSILLTNLFENFRLFPFVSTLQIEIPLSEYIH